MQIFGILCGALGGHCWKDHGKYLQCTWCGKTKFLN